MLTSMRALTAIPPIKGRLITKFCLLAFHDALHAYLVCHYARQLPVQRRIKEAKIHIHAARRLIYIFYHQCTIAAISITISGMRGRGAARKI